ncbi:hypothetical protein AAG906_033485 [Vitis piasezkii]
MEVNFVLLLGFLLVLLAVDSSYGADSEVKKLPNSGLDPKKTVVSTHTNIPNETLSGSDSGLDSLKAEQAKKDEDQVGVPKEGVESTREKISSIKQLDSKEADNEQTGKGSLSKELETEGGDNKKEKPGDGLKSKQASKEGGNEEVLESSKPGKKESLQGEECDPSNQCVDDINKLVACLRVPGNDSPDLSLLIQNKGKTALTVTISAPDFVKLESTKIELQEKEDKKVKVSIRNGGSDNSIVLTAGKGRCSLDFKDLIAQIAQKGTDNIPESTDGNFLTRTSSLAFLFFVALVAAASAWICISFKRKYFPSSGSKYQKLDMELPVSGGGKVEADINDGWDNSWGDTWDDEEAPKTPSMPLTPSLSARGLAARRLSKEGWKD